MGDGVQLAAPVLTVGLGSTLVPGYVRDPAWTGRDSNGSGQGAASGLEFHPEPL
jgi:hypothetical protein